MELNLSTDYKYSSELFLLGRFLDSTIDHEIFPKFPLRQLIKDIGDKHEIEQRVATVKDWLQKDTGNYKLSNFYKISTYAQTRLLDYSHQSLVAQLKELEARLYDNLAQELIEETNNGWMYVLECSGAMHREVLNALLQLSCDTHFHKIRENVKLAFCGFLSQVEDNLSAENAEIAYLCMHNVLMETAPDPQPALDDSFPDSPKEKIDVLAKNYLDLLKRCRSNVERNNSDWHFHQEENKQDGKSDDDGDDGDGDQMGGDDQLDDDVDDSNEDV